MVNPNSIQEPLSLNSSFQSEIQTLSLSLYLLQGSINHLRYHSHCQHTQNWTRPRKERNESISPTEEVGTQSRSSGEFPSLFLNSGSKWSSRPPLEISRVPATDWTRDADDSRIDSWQWACTSGAPPTKRTREGKATKGIRVCEQSTVNELWKFHHLHPRKLFICRFPGLITSRNEGLNLLKLS